MIKVDIEGPEQIVLRLEAADKRHAEAFFKTTVAQAILLQSHVKQQKLGGQVLKRRTGALSRSIAQKVEGSGDMAQASVGTNLSYAGIHEFGGKTKPHVIEAKRAKVLAFLAGGAQVFARRVNHPGSVMPERSYLRSSLKDRRDAIVAAYRQTTEALRA